MEQSRPPLRRVSWLVTALLALCGPAAAADTASVSLSGIGGQMAWSPTQQIVATVAVGPVALTHVLVNATLTDETTLQRFSGGDLRLCLTAAGNCKPIDHLDANSVQKVYLVPPNGVSPGPGKYTGAIELISAQAKASAVQTTVFVTSAPLKWLGVVVVVVASILSFLLAFGLRNSLAQKQLQAPAADLRDRFQAIKAALIALKAPDSDAPNTLTAITAWLTGLENKTLEKAGLIPAWWSLNPVGQTSAQVYQELLDRAGGWATALLHIQLLGLTPLKALRMTYANTGNATDVDAIVAKQRESLDNLIPQPVDTSQAAPAAIDQAINAVLQAAAKAVQDETNETLASPVGGAAVTTDGDRIRYQIMVLSLVNVAVAAIATAVVGSYVMVISHGDFGRPGDFMLCLFWGLGLPTAASQLALATPAGLATSLGVTLPKTS